MTPMTSPDTTADTASGRGTGTGTASATTTTTAPATSGVEAAQEVAVLRGHVLLHSGKDCPQLTFFMLYLRT
jgi:hypothetical protein